MQYSHHGDYNTVRAKFGSPDCKKELDEPDYVEEFEFNTNSAQVRAGGPPPPDTDVNDNKNKNSTLTTTEGTDEVDHRTISLPRLRLPVDYIAMVEKVGTVLFTLDLIMRLFSCPSLKRYFLSLANVIDLLAIVFSYLNLILVNIRKENKYQESWVKTINYFQIIRTFRLIRVAKNVRASRVLAFSVQQNIHDMVLLVILLLIGVSLSANVIYLLEEDSTVPSIPEGWYWSLITITTVGYGDVTPKTAGGKAVSSLLALCGVLLLSISLPMFVNNFLTLYQYSCFEDSVATKKQKEQSKNDDKYLDDEHKVDLKGSRGAGDTYEVEKLDDHCTKTDPVHHFLPIPGQVINMADSKERLATKVS